MIRPYFKYKPLNFGTDDHPFSENTFTVFPNPAQDRIQISHKLNETINWQLVNTVGQVVLSGTEAEISTSHLPRGLYILQLSARNIQQTEKILLQ